MAKTVKGSSDAPQNSEEAGANLPVKVLETLVQSRKAPEASAPASSEAVEPEGEDIPATESPPWKNLRVALIDDAMVPPSLTKITVEEQAAVVRFLDGDEQAKVDLASLGVPKEAQPDEKLLALVAGKRTASFALLGGISQQLFTMAEQHAFYLSLEGLLRNEVAEVLSCNPFSELPDLSRFDLVLLDYFLEPGKDDGQLATDLARKIGNQPGRKADQQIALMSSLADRVRDLRVKFRQEADIFGAAFAFIGKPDLNERWKVKAHLEMLGRARPYSASFADYRKGLDSAMKGATEGLLELVDDLDIGDYAFLQHRALMKDGNPLGDYLFWLLSSQLTSMAFEQGEMRKLQHDLDKLEFDKGMFAATEPSTIVAEFLNSALVSKQVGPLGPHPRAKPDGNDAKIPLVQLGDLFLDKERTKAIVVMSADCDLAFSPDGNREVDPETPVILVPGVPMLRKEKNADVSNVIRGFLHEREVYSIEWNFSKYRSVELGRLSKWLNEKGYDTSNRDRLRPLFGLKLQQAFGAHILRVGPPLIPPTTSKATGSIYVCFGDDREQHGESIDDLMITRIGDTAILHVTPAVATLLKSASEELLQRLDEDAAAKGGRQRENAEVKAKSRRRNVDNDSEWISMLSGIELNSPNSVKMQNGVGFVVGSAGSQKNTVCLEIVEPSVAGPQGTKLAVPTSAEQSAVVVSQA